MTTAREPEQIAIRIRLARLREVEKLAAMSRDYIESDLGVWLWHPRRLRESLRDRETCGIVALHGSAIAGFAVMRFMERQAHLNLLAVCPGYRRRGIGRQLLEWLEQSAVTAGIGEIQLEVRADNEAARRFYHALGYDSSQTLPAYYCGRVTAIRMRRNLCGAIR
jgi:ribosomal-protein-alanine N-acetyltransferase